MGNTKPLFKKQRNRQSDMVGLVQYPDTIRITREGSSVQDPNTGDWITTDGETLEFACRFVPNGSGKSIRLSDGTDYVYGYKIAFPFGTTDVRVRDNYERVGTDYKGNILQFEIGQLHSVAWV